MKIGAGCFLENSSWARAPLDSGDQIGAAWGGSPCMSPYAEAIAKNYPIQIPWYYTQRIVIDQTSYGQFIRSLYTTRPFLYDVLILAMSAVVVAGGTNISFLGLNIMDLDRAIPWVTPNLIGYAPLPAFCGLDLNVMPVLRLPEAFFLPSNTQMRIEATALADNFLGHVEALVTMIGVQLINHTPGFKRPESITMPSGDIIKVGSRMPWFSTVPFGRQQYDPTLGRVWGLWRLLQGERVVQFLPPSDCDVEIHDAYTNVFSPFAFIDPTDPDAPDDFRLLTVKPTDMRSRSDWTPGRAPALSVLGQETQGWPAMPFTKPHLLRVGHKIALSFQNNSSQEIVRSALVTLRGVRLCQF